MVSLRKMAKKFGKNMAKIAKSVQIHDKMLEDDSAERTYSLEGQVPPNYQGLLAEQRVGEDRDRIQEGALDPTRESSHSTDNRITDGAMDHRPSWPHRKDWSNTPVQPINIITEAHDQEHRSEYTEAESAQDKETAFWDKYVGDQLSGEKTKVKRNVPVNGSQLANRPERFKSMEGVAYHQDHNKNLGVDKRDNTITPLVGYRPKDTKEASRQDDLKAIRDADGKLFTIYALAAKEGRDLSEKEANDIMLINDVKRKFIAHMLENSVKVADINDPIDEQYMEEDDSALDLTPSIFDDEGNLLEDDPGLEGDVGLETDFGIGDVGLEDAVDADAVDPDFYNIEDEASSFGDEGLLDTEIGLPEINAPGSDRPPLRPLRPDKPSPLPETPW